MELKIDKKLDSTKGIPSDWSIESIRKLGEIKTGPFGTLLKADEYSRGSGVPLISVREIRKGYLQVDENTPLVPLSVRRRLPEYILEKGDIVFGRKGAVDRSAMVKEDQAGWFLGSDGIRIRPYNSNYSEFIAYQFQRQDIQAWLLQHATGTTMATLSQDILSRVSIPIATIPEQRAIATALSDVDSLIVALDKLIAKKRAIRTATLQQLLTGKKRLPGFSSTWTLQPLRSIAPLQRGFDLPTTRIKTGPFPVVYSNGILRRHSQAMVSGPGVVTGRSGTIGKVHYVEENYWPHNTSLWVTNFHNNDPRFVYYLYSFIGLERFGSGSGVPTLNRNDVHEHEIRIPEKDEQKAIATILSDMDAEIEALEARRGKTKEIKQGMMQELLTGKTRLV